MNKQEIERAIAWNEDMLAYAKDSKATYEDVCGTGDMTEEDREQLYNSMDSDIKMFETVISALTQQLNNGWIPVSERLPEEYLCKDREYDPSEYVLVQLDNGYMKTSRYWNYRHCKDTIIEQPWLDLKTWENVTAWQHLPEKYKEVSE